MYTNKLYIHFIYSNQKTILFFCFPLGTGHNDLFNINTDHSKIKVYGVLGLGYHMKINVVMCILVKIIKIVVCHSFFLVKDQDTPAFVYSVWLKHWKQISLEDFVIIYLIIVTDNIHLRILSFIYSRLYI